jgi:hypothetical protein
VKAKAGFSREQIEEEMKKGGSLPIWKVLRSRVRYFSDGAVLGSRSYVDSYSIQEFRHEPPPSPGSAHLMNPPPESNFLPIH